jgi:hypothetical protein
LPEWIKKNSVKPQYSQYLGHTPKNNVKPWRSAKHTIDNKASNSSYAAVSFTIVFYCSVTELPVYMSVLTRSSSQTFVIVDGAAMKVGHK